MAYHQRPHYSISISRDRDHHEQLVGRLRKTWFIMADRETKGRTLGEVWVDVSGMSEAEALSSVLVDLGLAVRGGLYDL